MTIHPVLTATSSAASTAMNAPSITILLLVSTVAAPVSPVPTVLDFSLVCVDCRQFVGVMLEYCSGVAKGVQRVHASAPPSGLRLCYKILS